MKKSQTYKWLTSIDQDVYDTFMQRACEDTSPKSEILQEIAHDAFLSYFPETGTVAREGIGIIRHIFIGGFTAAKRFDWPIEKTAKQLSRGLLQAVGGKEKDFTSAACTVIRAAVQSSILVNADLDKTIEKVLTVVLDTGKEKSCKSKELVKKASRAAADAAKSFPRHNTKSMQKGLLKLLEQES